MERISASGTHFGSSAEWHSIPAAESSTSRPEGTPRTTSHSTLHSTHNTSTMSVAGKASKSAESAARKMNQFKVPRPAPRTRTHPLTQHAEIHRPADWLLGARQRLARRRLQALDRYPAEPAVPPPDPRRHRANALRRSGHDPLGRHRREPVLEARRAPSIP